jgi:2-aminoadipate transaminase
LLTAPGAAQRVIYAGTYSKPFATGIRVGFGILPPKLLDVVLRIKGNHDFGTSNLLQQLIRRALASGRLVSHLGVVRERYSRKASAMVRAIRGCFPGEVQWQVPRGGLYIWARVPARVSTGPKSRLFRSALRHDVLYVPGALCYAADATRRAPDCEMRLSFGGARLSDIPKGIQRLGATLHEL